MAGQQQILRSNGMEERLSKIYEATLFFSFILNTSESITHITLTQCILSVSPFQELPITISDQH